MKSFILQIVKTTSIQVKFNVEENEQAQDIILKADHSGFFPDNTVFCNGKNITTLKQLVDMLKQEGTEEEQDFLTPIESPVHI